MAGTRAGGDQDREPQWEVEVVDLNGNQTTHRFNGQPQLQGQVGSLVEYQVGDDALYVNTTNVVSIKIREK